jgi:hypothetical protein
VIHLPAPACPAHPVDSMPAWLAALAAADAKADIQRYLTILAALGARPPLPAGQGI